MATILYSLAGEGRGHAARVKTVVDELRRRHRVVLFASGVASEFLHNCYRDTEVEVQAMPGLLFHYSRERLDYCRTIREGVKYLAGLRTLVDRLESEIRFRDADLVITDFEPALPRAARRCGVPFISLDHQHFLTVSDLSALPWPLRIKAKLSEPLVGAYYRGQAQTLVSSFYFPPLRKKFDGSVEQVGVLLRPDIIERRPRNDGHLVAYLRRFSPPNVIASLQATGREVRVYGLGERPADGNLHYHPVSDAGFLDDLVSCAALVCNAGNQLVGEALFLGKPVFALPEPKNFEQFINAHFLKDSGGGEWCEVAHVAPGTFSDFLARADEFQCRIDRKQLHGNPAVLAAIERQLQSLPQRLLPVRTRSTSHKIPA